MTARKHCIQTKHDLLYKTLKPLATSLVKRQISKAISDAVRTGLEYLDEQLVAVRSRYQEARADQDVSTAGTLSKVSFLCPRFASMTTSHSFSIPIQIFERKSSELSGKAESVRQKTGTFKVVSKRDSAIIPQGHGSGWINEMADCEAAAKSGEGWKSPAFNIVPTARAQDGAGAAPGAAAITSTPMIHK